MWIERFLSYQEELMGKDVCAVANTTKLFLGCPCCDLIIKLCNLEVPEELRAETVDSQTGDGPSMTKGHSLATSASSSTTTSYKDGLKKKKQKWLNYVLSS